MGSTANQVWAPLLVAANVQAHQTSTGEENTKCQTA